MSSEYGFDAVPRSQEKLLKDYKKESPYIPANEIAKPDTNVVRAVEDYVKKELSPETYNHSVRVYYYGMNK
jgi:cyanamide hydratase